MTKGEDDVEKGVKEGREKGQETQSEKDPSQDGASSMASLELQVRNHLRELSFLCTSLEHHQLELVEQLQKSQLEILEKAKSVAEAATRLRKDVNHAYVETDNLFYEGTASMSLAMNVDFLWKLLNPWDIVLFTC